MMQHVLTSTTRNTLRRNIGAFSSSNTLQARLFVSAIQQEKEAENESFSKDVDKLKKYNPPIKTGKSGISIVCSICKNGFTCCLSIFTTCLILL
jgi:hypothetical protein